MSDDSIFASGSVGGEVGGGAQTISSILVCIYAIMPTWYDSDVVSRA